MLLWMLLVIIAAIIFAGIVSKRPAEFRVTRSIFISAPPALVFAQVNDFHNWQAWSPWAKLDPAAKETFSGSAAGNGATFAWSGNKNVGAGSNTIIESLPHERIKLRLEFIRPFKAVNNAEFTFKLQGNQTAVTWSMFGQNNFMSKLMGLFMNCEKMLGSQFEQGLTQLKAVSEAAKK